MTTDEKLDLILQKIQSMDSRMQSMDDRLQSVEKLAQETFRELMIVEKQVLVNQDSIKELNIKYDTLLLKADNTELLLKLINRQSDEMILLKTRVELLEKKLA